MSDVLTFAEAGAVADLRIFLGRASAIEEGSVRLIASGSVLAVYAAVLYPVGLSDETPTVLGLRTFALAEPAELDEVVPLLSLRHRVDALAEEGGVALRVPTAVGSVVWAGIAPPRRGWSEQAKVDPEPLRLHAEEGMKEVADAVPAESGAAIVRKVRAEVWGREMPEPPGLPAGAAFAAVALGFLGEDQPTVHTAGPWTRLSSARGHVLIYQRPWSLRG